MSKPFYRFADRELMAWGNLVATKLTAAPDTFGVTAAQAAAMTDVALKFTEALGVWSDRAERTMVATTRKNAHRRSLLAYARYLMGAINADPAVTDDLRVELALIPRKKPTPVPAPVERPVLAAVGVAGHAVTVRVDSGQPGRGGRPPRTVGAYIYYFVGARYPTDPAGWTFAGAATKVVHTVVFPDAVPVGAQVWVTAAYVNAKSQTGPLAAPASAYLQFGMARAA